MRVYLGFDDTDALGAPIGTGRLVRMFERKLPDGAKLWGVLRHQLLIDPRIPFTSHNSPACAVVDVEDIALVHALIERAVAHILQYASVGSDPGLCVATADARLADLVEFGRSCTHQIETQARALEIAANCGVHLSGHGGTNDGIIGAMAAVGLTVHGWSGRFLEYGRLRSLKEPITPKELEDAGITAIATDVGARPLAPDVAIYFDGWLSPRLIGGGAVAPVAEKDGRLVAIGKKPRDAEVAE
jgi:hypothetical protein